MKTKRVAAMWRFREETEEYYKERHLKCWPELLKVFKDKGWHNATIWTAGDIAFLYAEVEADSFVAAMAPVDATGIKQKWQAEMNPMLKAEAIPGTGIQFIEMEEIWRVD